MLMTIKRPKRDNMKSSYSWHCRLGPTSERRMTELHNYGSLGSFECESFNNCESFLLGKADRVAEHDYGPLDLKHSDVCGLLSINAKGGFVTPRIPVRPDWRIRTDFRDARLRTGTLYLIFFLKANWYLWVWRTSYNRIKILYTYN